MNNLLSIPAVRTIFLMLGPKCNLSCKYCLQSLDTTPVKLNPDIFPFIEKIAEANPETPVHLQFFGGEPLLHWDSVIKETLDHFEGVENIQFSMITNGVGLTQEIVDTCNQRNVSICVSWDGPNTQELRGFDVLNSEKHRILLLQVIRLSLSAVVTSESYPVEIIDAAMPFVLDYHAATGNHCSINFDTIFQSKDPELEKLDLSRLYNDNQILCAELKKRLLNQEHNPYYAHHADQIFGMLTKSIKNDTDFLYSTCACENGYAVLNLGIDGTLYQCHNVATVLGNIYSGYLPYMKAVIRNDPTKTRVVETCQHCPVVAMCKGGCMLVPADQINGNYCGIKRAMFLPFIELLLSFDKDTPK
jgi:Arylsulfatase regulator (Fe-S oxidoreductase)